MNRDILFEAHRGVGTDCPENTLSAFRAAAAQGYDMIECDPKMTKDGVCILLHDGTLDRTGRLPDGTRLPEGLKPSDLTAEELRRLDFGVWFAPEFAGERIPLLAEALAFSAESGIPLKIDNVIESFTPEQRQAVYAMIREAGVAERIGITGAHVPFLAEVAEALPRAAVHYDGPVTEESLRAVKAVLKENALYVWLRYDNAATSWNANRPADPGTAALVHRFGRLGVWILREPEELEGARLLGADIIETDGSLKPEN